MKGIKECGNCLHWKKSEEWDEDWNPCENVMVEDSIAVEIDGDDDVGEEVELVFYREFSCRGFDYMMVEQEKG